MQLLESVDVEPLETKNQLYYKGCMRSGPVQFKLELFKGQLYIIINIKIKGTKQKSSGENVSHALFFPYTIKHGSTKKYQSVF